MRICVYEDGGVGNLEPLSLTRPVFDLRLGAGTLLDRQRRHFGADAVAVLVRPALADLYRLEHPGVPVNDPAWARAGGDELVVLVDARWLPPGAGRAADLPPGVGLVGEEVAYAVVPAGEVGELTPERLAWGLSGWKQSLPRHPAGGRLIAYPWDLVENNAAALEEDWRHWATGRERRDRPEGVVVLGPAERVVIDPAARVEPLAVLDATRGPVLIDRDAVVQAFSRVDGPCYVGAGTHLLGARVRGGSFGPECRIGGEVEASIVQGYSNKAHEGFLGHACLGEWVNLAACTFTSDLRNDYGPISVRVRGQHVETGLLKVGAFIGDHTKTTIGMLLNTGSVVGPFAHLVASGALGPRVVPAFAALSQGRLAERTDLRQLIATAATVMARRGRRWTETHAEFLFNLYEQTSAERRQLVRDGEQRRLRRVV